VAQAVGCLFFKCENLSSNPSPTKNKNRSFPQPSPLPKPSQWRQDRVIGFPRPFLQSLPPPTESISKICFLPIHFSPSTTHGPNPFPSLDWQWPLVSFLPTTPTLYSLLHGTSRRILFKSKSNYITSPPQHSSKDLALKLAPDSNSLCRSTKPSITRVPPSPPSSPSPVTGPLGLCIVPIKRSGIAFRTECQSNRPEGPRAAEG
jgi:hypothetical protein